MMIHMKTLLLIITILINFLKSNASPQPSEEGSSLPNYIPHTPRLSRGSQPPRSKIAKASPKPTRASSSQPNYNTPNSHSTLPAEFPTVYMKYWTREIKVILTIENSEVVAKRCVLLYRRDDRQGVEDVPDIKYKQNNNFFTRAVIEMHYGFPIKCVLYIKQDEYGEPQIFAAKRPPKPSDSYMEGNPKALNPDLSTWFITYADTDIEVKENPKEGYVYKLYLKNRQNFYPTQDDIDTHAVDVRYVYFGGLHFMMYFARNVVLGAALDHYWQLHTHLYQTHSGSAMQKYPNYKRQN